ncbi:nucleoside hydrolase [Patescibacteria group bacterium]
MINSQKIIIDTDPGHDDALAILLLVKSGLFDIKAVTTVSGNGTIQDTTNNARYVLDLLDCDLPLYSGASKPLKRDLIKAVVHGKGGLAGAEICTQEMLTKNASVKIIEIAKANPKEISLLTIGPLTNVARAIQQDSSLPSMLKEIVIMGGAVAVPGNKNRVAEFNIFVDLEAAEIVFNAPVKKTLVPLDLCNDIFFNIEEFEQLRGSSLYEPITSMMKPYIAGIEKYEKAKGALMYDPLAAYYLINSAAYQTTSMDIQIETVSELTRGMTVADRTKWGQKKCNVDVATAIDQDAFAKDFFATLKD